MTRADWESAVKAKYPTAVLREGCDPDFDRSVEAETPEGCVGWWIDESEVGFWIDDGSAT
jgi:hypothetical protein